MLSSQKCNVTNHGFAHMKFMGKVVLQSSQKCNVTNHGFAHMKFMGKVILQSSQKCNVTNHGFAHMKFMGKVALQSSWRDRLFVHIPSMVSNVTFYIILYNVTFCPSKKDTIATWKNTTFWISIHLIWLC